MIGSGYMDEMREQADRDAFWQRDTAKWKARAEAAEARVAELEAALAAPSPEPSRQGVEAITVDVQRMDTSRGPDFFVRILCGERSVTPHVFRERYKAEYEVAVFQWIFGQRDEEPDVLAYDENSHPNDAALSTPSTGSAER